MRLLRKIRIPRSLELRRNQSTARKMTKRRRKRVKLRVPVEMKSKMGKRIPQTC
jgi:hypothetical protein